MPAKFHAGLSGFLDRQGLSETSDRLDGAIVITCDRSFRIYCCPAPRGDLFFESRLLQLPEASMDAEDILERCLLASWLRMGTHADVPVVSEDGAYILLQQRLPSDATVDEVEQSLECFVNSIADWRRVLRTL